MKRILIVGSQHGNELLGELLFAYIKKQAAYPELAVEYLLANPEARRRHVRYIESDMNRSFTGNTNTYEEQQAQKLVQHIATKQYDLVIDAHTTTVSQAPCLIVSDIDAIAEYLRAVHIKSIVHMRHELAQRSLIGNVQNAASIEISNDQLNDGLFAKLYQGLLDFSQGIGHYPQKYIFEVSDLINKATYRPQDVKDFRNFQRSKQGFYPVLVGENSYKKQTDYLGFKAASKKVLVIKPNALRLTTNQL